MGLTVKREDWWGILLIAVIAVAFAIPLFGNAHNWSEQLDWDTAVMAHASTARNIGEYGQLPFWDAYSCGGNVLYAHPNYDHISPFVVLDLLFGEVVGIKLKILLFFVLGSIGAYLLARHFGAEVIPSMLAAAIFTLNGKYAQSFMIGQVLWTPLMYVPWLFLCFVKSDKQPKLSLVAAVLMALLVFEAVPYIFPMTIVLLLCFAGSTWLLRKDKRYLKPALLIILLGVALSAVRVLPMYDVFKDNSRQLGLDPNDHNSLYEMVNVFTNNAHTQPDWDPYWRLVDGKPSWYEYSFFIGWPAFILLLLALLLYLRSPLGATAVVFLGIMFGTTLPVWPLLHLFPLFSSQHNIIRYGMVFMLLAGVLVARLLSALGRKGLKLGDAYITKEQMRAVIAGLAIAIIIALILANRVPLTMAYTAAPRPADVNSTSDYFVVGNLHGFPWNFNMYRYFVVGKSMKECNIQPIFPVARDEQDRILAPEDAFKVQPRYFVVEYERIKANANHRQAFFFHSGELSTPWLIGDELNALLTEPWYHATVDDASRGIGADAQDAVSGAAIRLGEQATIQLVFSDAQNQYPHVWVFNQPAKPVFPSRTLKSVALSDALNTEYIRNSSVPTIKTTVLAGKTLAQQDMQLVIMGQLVLVTDLPTVADGQNVTVTFAESDEDIARLANPDYHGEAYLLGEKHLPGGQLSSFASIASWSPQRVVVDATVANASGDVLLLNTNYARGWKAMVDDAAAQPALNHRGLIGVKLSGGDHTVTFTYLPPLIVPGLIISLLALVAVMVVCLRGIRRKRDHAETREMAQTAQDAKEHAHHSTRLSASIVPAASAEENEAEHPSGNSDATETVDAG